MGPVGIAIVTLSIVTIIIGIVVIAVSVTLLDLVKDNHEHFGEYDSLQLKNILGFFIFIGVVWQLTSATVIYGVRKRSQPAICCFVISLLIMFIVEFAVGIAAAVVLKKEASDISARLLNTTVASTMPLEVKNAFMGDGIGMAALIISMALLQLVQVCCAISFRRAIASRPDLDGEEDQLNPDEKNKKFDASLKKLSKM